MEQYISKNTLVAELKARISDIEISQKAGLIKKRDADKKILLFKSVLSLINTLEVKKVNVWETVDNINPLQADRNKIYCVITKNKFVLENKNKYLTATVVNHPEDKDLLQWKCTEFPFRFYDMCEGDKYLQIV